MRPAGREEGLANVLPAPVGGTHEAVPAHDRVARENADGDCSLHVAHTEVAMPLLGTLNQGREARAVAVCLGEVFKGVDVEGFDDVSLLPSILSLPPPLMFPKPRHAVHVPRPRRFGTRGIHNIAYLAQGYQKVVATKPDNFQTVW